MDCIDGLHISTEWNRLKRLKVIEAAKLSTIIEMSRRRMNEKTLFLM